MAEIVRECEVGWEKQRVRIKTLQDEGGSTGISTTNDGETRKGKQPGKEGREYT